MNATAANRKNRRRKSKDIPTPSNQTHKMSSSTTADTAYTANNNVRVSNIEFPMETDDDVIITRMDGPTSLNLPQNHNQQESSSPFSSHLPSHTSISSNNESIKQINPEECKQNGNTFYRNGDYKKAIDCYSMAISASPNLPAYYGNRAAAHLMLSQPGEALKDINHILLLIPVCGGSAAGESAVGGGEAVNQVTQLSEEHASLLQKTMVRQARAHLLLGNWQETEFSCHSTLNKFAENSDVRDIFSKLKDAESSYKIYEEQKNKQDFRHALYCIESVLKHSPCSNKLQLKRIEMLINLRRFSEAKNWLENHIQEDSSSIVAQDAATTQLESLYYRGLCLHYMDQPDKAKSHFQHVLKLNPDHTECQKTYKRAKRLEQTRIDGNAAIGRREYQKAHDLYTEALAIDPFHSLLNAKLHCNRALALLHLGQAETALQDCDQAIRLDETFLKPRARRIKCLIGAEQFDKAVSEAHKLREQHPSQEHSQLYKEAQNELKRSKELNPYKILNLTKIATEQEIKKAYKKHALLHHPDRHTNADEEIKLQEEKKFKDISQAYTLLSDPRKRQMYDQGMDLATCMGSDSGGGGGPGFAGAGDPMKVFSQFFGGGHPGASSGGGYKFTFQM